MDRRQFTRIIFSTPAELRQGSKQWDTHLIDLSFKGALLHRPDDFDGDFSDNFLLTFSLPDMPNTILLNGTIMHSEDKHLGLHCDLMDIDSATHLRRLIELNAGDANLLNRELKALSAPDPENDMAS